MKSSVGLVSMGEYLPGKVLTKDQSNILSEFLATETKIPSHYIEVIKSENKLPGYIETNEDGWINQPWFNTWLNQIPEKKRNDPFQGTKERRRVPMDPISVVESIYPHPMLPSDAETIAASLAIIKWGGNKDDIDLLISHSQVRDHTLPSNASLLQDKLGLKYSGAFEVDSCCSTFVTLVDVATAFIKAGFKKRVLVVNSIIDSHINDKSDYYSVNTGDAAMAAIITQVEDDYGYYGSHSTSHGEFHDGIIFQRRSPKLLKTITSGPVYDQEFVTFYNPDSVKGIGETALENLKEAVDLLLKKSNFSTDMIDFLINHQPVAWAPDHWRNGLGFKKEQFYHSFQKYGNVATCSVPVNLLEAIEKDLIKSGDIVLLASSGAGENHIAQLQKISPKLINSIKGFMNLK